MSDLAENSPQEGPTLAQLVTRGGIYYNVLGSNCKEVMLNVIGSLPALPVNKNEELLKAVMEREALISTGIENGIALPHPRTPMLNDDEEPFVAIAFPILPLDWPTPDGSAVHTFFLIVSKSPKQHLGVLSKINFLCQQKEFFNLISARAPKEEIIAAIEKIEGVWR